MGVCQLKKAVICWGKVAYIVQDICQGECSQLSRQFVKRALVSAIDSPNQTVVILINELINVTLLKQQQIGMCTIVKKRTRKE